MSEEIKVALTAVGSQAMAVLAKVASAVENTAKKMTRKTADQLPILNLTPQTLQQLEFAASRTNELRRQTIAAGNSARMGGQGFLQLSYALQDMQYGFRGVINNLPMIAQGFGGGAGLAGGLMLAAMAGNMLWPQIQKLYGAMDNDAVKKAAEEWGQVFEAGMKAAAKLEDEAAIASNMVTLADSLTESYRQRLGVMGQMTTAYDEQLSAQQKERNLALEILAARKQMMVSLGGDIKPYVVKRQGIEQAGISADLKNRETALKSSQYDGASLATVRDNIRAENSGRDAADVNRLAAATRNLAFAEENLKKSKFWKENTSGKEQSAYADSEARAARNVERIKGEIAVMTEQNKVRKESGDTALKAAEAAVAALDKKINKTYQEIEALKALKKQTEELHKIERQQVAIDEAKKRQSELKTAQPQLEKAVETAKSQQQVVGATTEELEILRTTVKEGKKAGDAMREKLDLAREAAALAKDGGISEQQAEKLLRERNKLAKEIAKIPTGTIKERAETRAAERDQKRTDLRNEKVAEAQRKREARGQDGKPVDFDKRREDLKEITRKAEDTRAKAQEELTKNIKEQTDLQKKIEKAIQAITAV